MVVVTMYCLYSRVSLAFSIVIAKLVDLAKKEISKNKDGSFHMTLWEIHIY